MDRIEGFLSFSFTTYFLDLLPELRGHGGVIG